MGDSSDDIKENEEIVASIQTANTELGITQQYTGNRSKHWDSTEGKQQYRDKVFGDKQTIVDENTGQVLHKSHNAAKRKYHQKDKDGNIVSTKWAEHAAEVDHKISLESLHDASKHNAFLTDDDLKEIANSEVNYRIISKKENASKGSDNTADFATHASLQVKFAGRTVKNMSKEFVDGAAEGAKGAVFYIIVDGVEKVLIENKSVGETLKESGAAVLSAATVTGTEKLLIDIATQTFQNSGNEILKSIVAQNAVGQMLVMSVAVGRALVKYLDGEIDEKRLVEEIALNGAMIVMSTAINMAVPIPLLGPAISMIAVQVATSIYETRKHMDDYLIKERKIKQIANEGLKVMAERRATFKEIVDGQFREWDSAVTEGLTQLVSSSWGDSYSLHGMVAGLDKILALCDESAAFHTVEEYEAQLDQTLNLCF